jgi:hypothetical protein
MANFDFKVTLDASLPDEIDIRFTGKVDCGDKGITDFCIHNYYTQKGDSNNYIFSEQDVTTPFEMWDLKGIDNNELADYIGKEVEKLIPETITL